MDKIKDDESAGLFSTGFPNHGALISFYNFSCMDELLLILIRLRAGLFVQDLPYRFGITRSLAILDVNLA